MIDSHCHIDFTDFDHDRAQILKQAKQQNIEKIIVPGVISSTWEKIKQYCDTYPQLIPCYGLHPYFIEQHCEADLSLLENCIKQYPTAAIGECGLDFFLKELDPQKQQFYFEAQLDIALAHNLPVVIHARKSTEAVIKAIKQRPGLSGMIHSYSGSYEQGLQLIKLNFYLSFGGAITYDRATRLRKTVQKLPLEAILLETDAPDQPAASHHQQRNEPAFLKEVLYTVAELKDLAPEEVAIATTENTQRCFRLV